MQRPELNPNIDISHADMTGTIFILGLSRFLAVIMTVASMTIIPMDS